MKSNPYTLTIDSIHAPEYAVENAIKAAMLRAANTASNQAKVRYAAVAASIVLAGAAAVSYYKMFGSFQPPAEPSGLTPTVTASENVSEPSETVTATEAKAGNATEHTQKPSESTAATETESAETVTESKSDETVNSAHIPTEAARPETEKPTSKPTERVTEKATQPPIETEPEYVEVPPIDVDVDSSQLGDDGKLYCMIAETAYDVVNDPDAFSDSHVYYVETKFGRYRQWFDYGTVYRENMSNMKYVFYNSDGVVLYTEPLSTN